MDSRKADRTVHVQNFVESCQRLFERYVLNVHASLSGDEFVTVNHTRVRIDTEFMKRVESAHPDFRFSSQDPSRWRVEAMMTVCAFLTQGEEHTVGPCPYTCSKQIQQCIEHCALRDVLDPAARVEIHDFLLAQEKTA